MKFLRLFFLSSILVFAASCGKSKNDQMSHALYASANELTNAQAALNAVQVSSSYEVLSLVGDKIPADVTIKYPVKYFASETIVTLTPVLVYEGGEQVGKPFYLQGDKVKDNYPVISNKNGGSYTAKMNFDYVPGVEKSHLELRSVATYKTNSVNLPTVKVVEGCSLVQQLAQTHGEVALKADNYQSVIRESAEGQIMYDKNSDVVKSKELRSESIKELQAALAEIESDPRYTITGTKIISYASPEGGVEHNAKLSDKRAASAQKAWNKATNGLKADGVVVESMGQDWDGFQEAIRESNIDDKELILRVLSMYSDPAVRESEIKNMSKVYTEINENVFPELRRARFIAEVEYQNFSDAELEELASKAIDALDEEALLRVAANASSNERAVEIYKVAYNKFASKRAAYNIAAIALHSRNLAEAEKYLALVDASDADVQNAKGVVELQKGNLAKAKAVFSKLNTPEAKANLGTVAILEGDYANAAKIFANVDSHNKAVAYILNKEYDKAAAAIPAHNCARSNYLHAIVAARQGKATEVTSRLEKVAGFGAQWKAKADKDIEFAKYR